MIIDNACEIFQNWEGNKKEEYLVFCADSYKPGCGVKLDELINVGCNTNTCVMSTVVTEVTSWNIDCNILDTRTAYLSVTPYRFPYEVEYASRFDTIQPEFTGLSGQHITIYFDPKNPWKARNICNANCIEIRPVSSQWFQLSSNPFLLTHFNFED